MTTALSAREILDRLVSFPTVSRDSNLDLVDFVEEYLAVHGVTAHRVWNEERTKAGLFASIGPDEPGGIVLSGHTDVVPVDGQSWDSDPFRVVERDGRLFGRGTCDMKGFDALALAAVPLALERGVKRPLQIALSIDEEIGCTGAPPLIRSMNGVVPKAAAVIVGEPSMMKVVTAHKGGAGFHVDVKGHEVHSSLLPQGVSAIMEAARMINWVNDVNDEIQAADPGEIGRLFDPPFTTLHVGEIHGGTAHNITAADCRFGLEFRCIPDEGIEDWKARIRAEAARLEAGMRARRPGTGIVLSEFFSVPPLSPETDGIAEEIARRLTGDNGLHVVSYGTEAGHFQEGGYSVVVCGPGDIRQAHQANEYLSVSQFAEGQRFMERLVDSLCA